MIPRIWVLIALLSVGTLVVHPSPSWGADPEARLDEAAGTVDRAATTPAGQDRVAARVAQELNASWGQNVYSAASLSAQRAQTGWGWGELLIGNRLAQTLSRKTGMSLTEATAKVTAERQQGTGWGAIANAHDLKVGSLVGSVEKVAKSVEKAEKAAEKGARSADNAGTKGAEKAGDKAAKDADKADPERGGSSPGGGAGAGAGGGPGGGGGKGK